MQILKSTSKILRHLLVNHRWCRRWCHSQSKNSRLPRPWPLMFRIWVLFSEMSSKEGAGCSGALFSNQLCGFRRPKRERTSGLSTLGTLFRKLKRLVVVSEMTRLKFWSWHKLLLLVKETPGAEAARAAGGPNASAAVLSADNCSSAS